MINMVVIHIGHHVDDREQTQEGTVGFVGLGDDILALAQAAVGPVSIDQAADAHRGVQPRRVENGRRQRGGGSFAVRARHRDARAQPHQFGQHLCARNNRNALGVGRLYLGIVLAHSRRLHHHLRVAHVFGRVADADVRPQGAQMLHRGPGRQVRPVHRVPQVQQYFRYAAHPRAAYPDHVYGAYFVVHVAFLDCRAGRRSVPDGVGYFL